MSVKGFATLEEALDYLDDFLENEAGMRSKVLSEPRKSEAMDEARRAWVAVSKVRRFTELPRRRPEPPRQPEAVQEKLI